MRCRRRLLAKARSVFVLGAALSAVIAFVTFVNRGILWRTRWVSGGGGLIGIGHRRPGGFLDGYVVKNVSYCRFGYDLPDAFSYTGADVLRGPELAGQSGYRILYNVLAGGLDYGDNGTSMPPVTYATHVTPEFINYISEIAKHWEGAVSVAAFVPDRDADLVTTHLLQICHCLPEMSKVSIHYIFPDGHPPKISPLNKPSITCVQPDPINHPTYRSFNHLPYPINTARNVARGASTTRHILVSDVELLPSAHLATKFIEMLQRLPPDNPNRVYVLPVFEIEEYAEVPRTKSQLLRLIRDEQALYFHRHICSHCQKFPGLETWLQQDPGNTVKPLLVGKREYPFHRWEPIYIGTKDEPLYSEALSWEGKQDKMTQMLEMCLRGYRFVILDGAFLIHWPGVKRRTAHARATNHWRGPYQRRNARHYASIVERLSRTYKRNARCKL